MQVTIVAGARPNFMKVAPIIKAIEKAQINGSDIQYRLVHTGQHYDTKMSGDFFDQLGIPDPHCNLACGGGTVAEQTAAIMVKFEQELILNRPDMVLVVGDVTSTMACAITAKKMCIQTAHVEAGIRSGDISMPEEVNRMVTDAICDAYFTTTELANHNLLSQQISRSKIHLVGNTMVDTLFYQLPNIKAPDCWSALNLSDQNYFLLTLHRPSNVDNPEKLVHIIDAIMRTTQGLPVIFPVHPRTRKKLATTNYQFDGLYMIDPQPYLQFIYLVKNAKGIITDSGGITEEATMLNVPCLTMRKSTERPETVLQGSNELVGDDIKKLGDCIRKILNGDWKHATAPNFWDGRTSDRIVDILLTKYLQSN
jgi:UDP-N-acetylglucosamine 2-epimerase (non-hydrolysing)